RDAARLLEQFLALTSPHDERVGAGEHREDAVQAADALLRPLVLDHVEQRVEPALLGAGDGVALERLDDLADVQPGAALVPQPVVDVPARARRARLYAHGAKALAVLGMDELE